AGTAAVIGGGGIAGSGIERAGGEIVAVGSNDDVAGIATRAGRGVAAVGGDSAGPAYAGTVDGDVAAMIARIAGRRGATGCSDCSSTRVDGRACADVDIACILSGGAGAGGAACGTCDGGDGKCDAACS